MPDIVSRVRPPPRTGSGTCKHTPNRPTRGFATIEKTRARVQGFANGSDTAHRRSAIRATPDPRHRGKDRALMASRHPVCAPARAARPERWSGRTRNWHPIRAVRLDLERPEAGRRGHGSADALPTKRAAATPRRARQPHSAKADAGDNCLDEDRDRTHARPGTLLRPTGQGQTLIGTAASRLAVA
jgi:hypothetical protein